MADKGLVTDGASIPTWAQPIVGGAFDKEFVSAAVIHDHYCDRHVRPWRQTHKVFHEALRASGVPAGKAGIMYFAVLVGGPKWVKLTKGKPCPVGMGCINQVDVYRHVPGAAITVSESGVVMARPDMFESAVFAEILAANQPELEKAGDALTPEMVEDLAGSAMAGDFYFANGDEVGSDLGLSIDFE